MAAALIIFFLYLFVLWLVFAKLRIAKFSIVWGIVSFWVGVHLLLVFLIGIRFYQPYSTSARVVRHTVQIIPRLPHPTLLEQVMVQPETPVKKGTPLFRFKRTLYQSRVNEIKAQLASARSQAAILDTDLEAAEAELQRSKDNVAYAKEQVKRQTDLVAKSAGREATLESWQDKLDIATASVEVSESKLQKAQLAVDSTINGVNTKVAEAQARLTQAEYYLSQTTIVAPADGMIVNLQARPGLVVGGRRIGAIASFIADEDPYLLAPITAEHLKFIEPGQPVEIALDLYPGQIFTGKVEHVWWGTGQGQFQPSGKLPKFVLPQPKGKFAVRIGFDHPDSMNLPIGAQGAAAIYTGKGKNFAPLRRIVIRTYSLANWLYPLPI